MTLPVKSHDDMPANFQYWTTPDLGRGPVVARAACMRALLTMVKNYDVTDVTAPLDRAAGLVATLKSLPSDWKRGLPPDGVTRDPFVQDALRTLGSNQEWWDNVAGFIRRGRYGQAMGSGQFLDVVPILLPRRETPEERSGRLRRIFTEFQPRVPDAREAVVVGLLNWAMTSLLATPQARAHATSEGSEWVFESGPIYQSMERMGDLTVRLTYPQDDFPESLVGRERLDFLHEMHGRIAEEVLRADGRLLLGIAVGLWRRFTKGEGQCRDPLVIMSPVLPLEILYGDWNYFGACKESLEEKISFIRAIQGFRGDTPEDDETMSNHLINTCILDGFFSSRWATGGNKTDPPENLADIAKKLGIW